MISGWSSIDDLLRPGALRTAFQPVFSLAAPDQPYAYEALTRGPVGSTLASSSVLFEYVRRKGLEGAFDRHCVARALRAAATLPKTAAISLNVHASTFDRDVTFPQFLIDTASQLAIGASRLIIEIIEHTPLRQSLRQRSALAELRLGGVAIALDDFGAGQSTYRMLLEIRPEFLKVDRCLVQGCDADTARQAVLTSIRCLTEALGAQCVAEGIETESELRTVRELGVPRGQGYLLGAPFPAEMPWSGPEPQKPSVLSPL